MSCDDWSTMRAPVQQARGRGVDDPVAIARQHDGLLRRGDPDDPGGSCTSKRAIGGGSAARAGVRSSISSSIGSAGSRAVAGGLAVADRLRRGRARGSLVSCRHRSRGCGVRKRSYSRSDRSTTSPTPNRLATAAREAGLEHALLEPPIERVEQQHRAGRALREHLA